jgi:hypothetical protein
MTACFRFGFSANLAFFTCYGRSAPLTSFTLLDRPWPLLFSDCWPEDPWSSNIMVSRPSAPQASSLLSGQMCLVLVISWLDAISNAYDAALTITGWVLQSFGY